MCGIPTQYMDIPDTLKKIAIENSQSFGYVSSEGSHDVLCWWHKEEKSDAWQDRCIEFPMENSSTTISSNGEWVASLRSNQLCVWYRSLSAENEKWDCAKTPFTAELREISNDGMLVITDPDEQGRIAWDAISGKSKLRVGEIEGDWEIQALSSNGEFIALGINSIDYQDGSVQVWSIANHTKVAQFDAGARVLSLDFNNANNMLAIGTEQGRNVIIWKWVDGANGTMANIATDYPVQALEFDSHDISIYALIGSRTQTYARVENWIIDFTSMINEACKRVPLADLSKRVKSEDIPKTAKSICDTRSP